MSTHEALVVKVELLPHINSDNLSIVNVGGYSVCVKTEDWKNCKLGVYITPDSIVDTKLPQFSFLKDLGEFVKIKVKKLRGIYSQGLLVPAPDDAVEGEDYYDEWKIQHYEPELTYTTGGTFIKAPDIWSGLSKYDIENARASKIRNMFVDGEDVVVTAKLNGSNCAYCYDGEKIIARSRSGFRGDGDNIFYQALTPEIEQFCKEHQDTLIYGEVYGTVKGYKYDTNGKPTFRCFDIMNKNRQYVDYSGWLLTCNMYKIPTVPIIGVMPFNFEELLKLAEKDCPLSNPTPEGIVVRPFKERIHDRHGRVIAKIVSNRYLGK